MHLYQVGIRPRYDNNLNLLPFGIVLFWVLEFTGHTMSSGVPFPGWHPTSLSSVCRCRITEVRSRFNIASYVTHTWR